MQSQLIKLDGLVCFDYGFELTAQKECFNMVDENDGFGRKCIRNRESN